MSIRRTHAHTYHYPSLFPCADPDPDADAYPDANPDPHRGTNGNAYPYPHGHFGQRRPLLRRWHLAPAYLGLNSDQATLGVSHGRACPYIRNG